MNSLAKKFCGKSPNKYFIILDIVVNLSASWEGVTCISRCLCISYTFWNCCIL